MTEETDWLTECLKSRQIVPLEVVRHALVRHALHVASGDCARAAALLGVPMSVIRKHSSGRGKACA